MLPFENFRLTNLRNRFIKAARTHQSLTFFVLSLVLLVIIFIHFRSTDVLLKNLLISTSLILYVTFYKLLHQTTE